MNEVIVLNAENVIKTLKKSIKALRNHKPIYLPYINATGYEKKYKKTYGEMYDKICFTTKGI